MIENDLGMLEALIDAAVRAPSGDNTQPWRFVVDPVAGRIALQADEGRDPSPMNAGQRMSRIAAGAALENLLQTAQHHDWTVELEPADGRDLAVVRLVSKIPGELKPSAAVVARVTNRRLYDARPLAAGLVDELDRETQSLGAVFTRWIVGNDRLTSLAPLIGRADALMFGEASMRKAFLSQVRFDAPHDSPVAEGLPLDALELTASDRMAMRVMRRIPDWLFQIGGATRVFATKARQLVESSSGLCLVVAPDGTESTDLIVGRVMERAWLALTARGMAVQPMMSLPVLENLQEHGGATLVNAVGGARLAALFRDFRTLAPEIGAGRPAFLMRFGFAPAPTGRTGRRPLQAVMHQARGERTEPVNDLGGR